MSNPNPTAISILAGALRTTEIITDAQQAMGFDAARVQYHSNGTMSFADVSSLSGWSGRINLIYDLSGLTLPLILDGVSGLQIHFLAFDAPGGNTLGVTATLGSGSPGPLASAVAGPQALRVDFDTPVIGNPQQLTVTFDVPLGGDFRLNQIVAVPVPEPGTGALLMLGLTGLSLAGRKHESRGNVPARLQKVLRSRF